ncbi:MAG: DUF2752 domain-containing protein [Thermoguttaceae bacterium]|nr:DUF2752 domain-containing protein [Thermoguttaceae bacterium]
MSTTGTKRCRQAALQDQSRRWAALLGVGLLVPLVVARLLEPDPRGRGTHEQLGLPPCSSVALLGVPCPTCGMTTAWAHSVRGHMVEAFRASAAGTLLAALDLAAALWLLASALCARWLGRPPTPLWGAWLAGGVLGVTLIDWALRLWTV